MSASRKKAPTITITARPRASSEDSYAPSIKPPSLQSPRAARFAEATAVDSPVDAVRPPFAGPPTRHVMAQPQVSDVGFGYMGKHESVEMPDTDNNDYPHMQSAPRGPLKSAMRTPGAPPRDFGNILSPTFKEEDMLEKQEALTEKTQAQDLKVKTRVRMAKMLLRGVNFSCSLIVLSMLATTFQIFNATRALPPRNSLPPWANNQKTWPQITLLVIACVSLFFSLLVFYGYWKGGHKRAEKAAVYYSAFAVAFFVFSIVMWGIGAGILQSSKTHGNNKDMWGWACVDNTRRHLFQNEVSYDLICRLQNWSLVCCVIEVVVETITIAVYAVAFHRFYSKRQLRKSMAVRDRARSDLYLAQLRSQSAPNTPGFAALYSARDGAWKPPLDSSPSFTHAADLEEGVQYIDPEAQRAPSRPFQLQPAPLKNPTPKMQQLGFTPSARSVSVTPPLAVAEDPRSPLVAAETLPQQQQQQQQEHFGAAPGEQVYESVPIPGAYEAPLSPGLAPRGMHFPQ